MYTIPESAIPESMDYSYLQTDHKYCTWKGWFLHEQLLRTIAWMPSLLCRSQISIGAQFGQFLVRKGCVTTDSFFGMQCTQINSWTLLVRPSFIQYTCSRCVKKFKPSVKQDRWIIIESKWPERTCKDAVIDMFVQEKFEPPVRTKIMMILSVRFVQTR